MRGMTVDTAHPPGSWTFVTDPGGHTEPPGPPEPPDLTDALHHARHGHQPGFVTLYRDLQPRLLRYATVLVGRDDADDVTAEAWLQIVRDLPAFTGNLDGFRGWATTIVRNRAMDLLRAGTRRPATPSGLDEFTDRAAPADTAAAALETLSTDVAIRLIASLPRTEAEAVVLRVVIGLDTASTCLLYTSPSPRDRS